MTALMRILFSLYNTNFEVLLIKFCFINVNNAKSLIKTTALYFTNVHRQSAFK